MTVRSSPSRRAARLLAAISLATALFACAYGAEDAVILAPAVLDNPKVAAAPETAAIFFADGTQKRIAESYIAQLNGTHAFAKPIVTHLEPLRGFFEAETYHQDFLVRHPTHPYIAYNDLPKVENLKRVFPELYRDDPVLVNAR